MVPQLPSSHHVGLNSDLSNISCDLPAKEALQSLYRIILFYLLSTLNKRLFM